MPLKNRSTVSWTWIVYKQTFFEIPNCTDEIQCFFPMQIVHFANCFRKILGLCFLFMHNPKMVTNPIFSKNKSFSRHSASGQTTFPAIEASWTGLGKFGKKSGSSAIAMAAILDSGITRRLPISTLPIIPLAQLSPSPVPPIDCKRLGTRQSNSCLASMLTVKSITYVLNWIACAVRVALPVLILKRKLTT